jgi:hypothetical protein
MTFADRNTMLDDMRNFFHQTLPKKNPAKNHEEHHQTAILDG